LTYSLAELQRRMALMIRVGAVSAVDASDPKGPRCMVSNGGLETDWLPWLAPRAGADSEFWAPEIGEQAVVFSPFGDQAQGIVLFGIPQDALPAPETNPDRHVRKYKDGAVVSYDRAAHDYLVSVPAGGNITLQVGSTSLVLQDGKATLNASEFDWNGDSAKFAGTLAVQLMLSFMNGISGQQGNAPVSAAIAGGLKVTGGDIQADAISLKGHHHDDPQGGESSNAKP
jgi:phage baseplate assembly protein V